MKRLTQRDEFGNCDIIALSDVMPELYGELKYSEANHLTDALNRLAAYEDTGLTPEEVERVNTFVGSEMAFNYVGKTHIARWARAKGWSISRKDGVDICHCPSCRTPRKKEA